MTPKPVRLHLMHVSMQYSDTEAQMKMDAGKIFARAAERGVSWITGTEASARGIRSILKGAAVDHGYKFAVNEGYNDSWVAVQKSLITGGWDTYFKKTMETAEGVGHHGPRGVFAAEFDTENLGHITVIAAHYVTRGRPGGSPEYSVNAPINRELTQEIGAYAKEQSKGRALVFYGGDQNIVDRTDDTFMGQPLTSAWDELKKWENTGHGNIDVIASYDADSRVSAAYSRALDDKEFPLHTDHFLVEAGFDVLPLG